MTEDFGYFHIIIRVFERNGFFLLLTKKYKQTENGQIHLKGEDIPLLCPSSSRSVIKNLKERRAGYFYIDYIQCTNYNGYNNSFLP